MQLAPRIRNRETGGKPRKNGKMGARGMCEKSIEPDSQCTCYGYGCEVRLTRGGGYEFAAENVAAQPQKKCFQPELCHLTVSEFAQFIIF